MIRRTIARPSDKTFTSPEKLPSFDEEREIWQEANKDFWENNSMRYDWDEPIKHAEYSEGFYEEIDSRFFSAVKMIAPWKVRPFEQWINYEGLKAMDVLEIGVGNGSHAQLISPHTKSYTGIDLTSYAVKSTTARMQLRGIAGSILQMDAEKMSFPDKSFDFIWSWGVIHHSSNTDIIIDQMHRVLRNGGKAVVMVYYRGWFSYYVSGILHGVFKGLFFKGKSLHQVVQIRSDGALARFYTFKTWRTLVGSRFRIHRMEVFGNKADILPLPGSKFKSRVLNLIPTSLSQVLIRKLRMGTGLICEMQKV